MSQNSARQFRIEHSTAYRYSEPVMLSHQQLHLTPRLLDYQTIQAHEAVIKPAPTQQRKIIDAFGNPVTEIAIEAAHTSLDIIAQSTVTVTERRSIDPEKTRPGYGENCLWIITEADRTRTTVLLPAEY